MLYTCDRIWSIAFSKIVAQVLYLFVGDIAAIIFPTSAAHRNAEQLSGFSLILQHCLV